MRKLLVAAALIFGVVFKSWATLPVIDYAHIAQDAGNEVVNLAKWTASEVHEAATELNTLNTYENEVLQLTRMGDPRTLTANIPGVQNIQTLGQIYSQAEQDISDWSSFVNPQSWKLTSDQILQIYGQPGFDGFTAANGMHVGAARSLVQFDTSNYNVDKGAQATVDKLNQQLKTLTDQLSKATDAMQSATTQSQVQKYEASIQAIHSAIDATNGALQQAKFSQQLQVQQNATAERITRSTQAQQTQVSDMQAIDEGLRGLPTAQMNSPILWGSQP